MTSLFNDFKECIEECFQEAIRLTKEIAVIPAPSGQEARRARLVCDYLRSVGAPANIDGENNVIVELGEVYRGNATVFCAHTDIVFPESVELKVREEDGRLYCPGIGDDTACLAVMLTVIAFIRRKRLKPKRPLIFVANSCEEGLGNLRGTRAIMKTYEGLVSEFYSFDSQYTALSVRAVGSHRYKVECKTQGGHSFGEFGNENAIVALSRLIGELYSIPLPSSEDSVTTYNVGTIEGGTSVNTIAERASMLYEYRSDDADCLDYMKKEFFGRIEAARNCGKASFEVTEVGVRPCGKGVDRERHEEMISRASDICRKHSGLPCFVGSGSTDCNIPLSMGIPAVCLGVFLGAGAHTEGEYIYKDSLKVGLLIAGELILEMFE